MRTKTLILAFCLIIQLVMQMGKKVATVAVPGLLANNSCASSSSCTTAAANTAGAKLLVLTVSSYGATAISVSSSPANTWTPKTKYTTPDAVFNVQTFYAWNPTVGASQTFTCNGQYMTCKMSAWSHIQTSSDPFDVENGNAVNAAPASIQVGSVSPTNGDLAISGIGCVTNQTISWAVNSSLTILNNVAYSAGVNEPGADAYLSPTTGSLNPTWTTTFCAETATSIETFKAGP